MKTLARKIFSTATILVAMGTFAACSSSGDSKETQLSNEEFLAPVEEIPAGAEAIGLMTFFNKGEDGVVVKDIKWNAPLSSENPGADCSLLEEKPGVFSCTVEKDGKSVSLSVRELNRNGVRRLHRVFIRGQGEENFQRWINQLEINGFSFRGEKDGAKLRRRGYVSADGLSRAEVVFNKQSDAVLVILGKN